MNWVLQATTGIDVDTAAVDTSVVQEMAGLSCNVWPFALIFLF